MLNNVKKFFRYISVYGFSKSFVKAIGRKRVYFPFWVFSFFNLSAQKKLSVGLIGCGQFCFSTIAYYLTFSSHGKVEWCMDKNIDAAKSLAKSFGIKQYSDSKTFKEKKSDIIYISTYHSTHADYAIKHLENGSDVYVEKPLCTNWDQFNRIQNCLRSNNNRIYVGYNRPFAPLILKLKKMITKDKPFSIAFFITGHYIEENHWYRNAEEGTRICGNLGHWLDLSIHLIKLKQINLTDLEINITYSDIKSTSENLSVTITTPDNDMIVIIFSTRGEPFEGVSETINFQQGDIIAKIDDHKEMKIWNKDNYHHYKNRLKDVGHKAAILQPFLSDNKRDWEEVIVSTKLILTVTDMVNNSIKYQHFRVK